MLVKESYQLIQKDFRLEGDTEIEEANIGFDWLENYLTKRVENLLNHDFNGLLNALYRIDIPESKTKELLTLSESADIARNIARTIIDREKQKVLTRRQFRQT